MSGAVAPISAEYWPWVAIVSLGLFHGVNPAMGWLFAVALGLHRHNRRVVLLSLIPIAAGHAAAVGLVVIAVLALGIVVNLAALTRVASAMLLGFAAWHAVYGHRHRLQFGMQTGFIGLLLWSFVMASAHGAGLMLIPTLIPVCLASSPAKELIASGSLLAVFTVIGVHTAAMLATIAIVSLAVYNWVGVAFLRRGWINLDLVWTVALSLCGFLLLVN
jgi:hypothetical protein